ncbi:MAG: hypothetical protein R2778_11035 [Saprospiraceae bacterium]
MCFSHSNDYSYPYLCSQVLPARLRMLPVLAHQLVGLPSLLLEEMEDIHIAGELAPGNTEVSTQQSPTNLQQVPIML